MGTRRELRKKVALSVRIFGIDSTGRIFSESVSTVDVSFQGAMLNGVNRPIEPGEVIGITYGKNKARFRVQWVGQPGTAQQGRIGVQNLAPSNCLWGLPLPERGVEEPGRAFSSLPRLKPRMKCSASAELRPTGQAPMWSNVGDISEGGCFVEMMIPIQPGTRLKISIWLKDNKVLAEGVVANTRPGFGVGIRFTEMSPQDATSLKDFLKSLIRFPAHV
jgi:hypothetical protein